LTYIIRGHREIQIPTPKIKLVSVRKEVRITALLKSFQPVNKIRGKA
jgi:hypothetical protein